MVFTINKDELLSTLLIVLRPSATTSGIDAKSLLTSTSCEIFLAASLPDDIATEQSASFRARTSFTPSPIIATL